MSSQTEIDDDSFIIVLRSSPTTGMYDTELDKSQIEDAMKDLSLEANMAFKAQFSLGDSPSPSSMMAASTLITDDRSTQELQRRYAELLDENVVLKETLKENNNTIRKQLMLISECQDSTLEAHMSHSQKFKETMEFIEKLRKENKHLKQENAHLVKEVAKVNNETGEKKSPQIEFVTSPDDDTINKLTAQLELVEKQRRQVIADNDKLKWLLEAANQTADAITKERDDLRVKLDKAEYEISIKDEEHARNIKKKMVIIDDLNCKLKSYSLMVDEISKRDAVFQSLQTEHSMLQNELKKAQIKILDLENIKLEFEQHKSGTLETVKMYKEQIQEMNNKIKDVQKTVFQPVDLSLATENESSSEYSTYIANVKRYDRTLKHLSEYLNALTNGLSDSLVHSLGVVASLHDYKLERASIDRVKSGLSELRLMIEKQHKTAISNIGQVRGTLVIFEGIFKDYNELLKKSVTKTENVPAQLSAALLAREQEITALRAELADCDLLRAQADSYRSDFEAEREAREKMASEKETILTDLRTAQRKIKELTNQLEEIRILSPGLHKSVTSKREPTKSTAVSTTTTTTTNGNTVYKCPKCMRFSSNQYKAMEEHFDDCLDDF
ncbi:unnamed protein product [Euphydryas editha]|uniref:NF-kappa-B essential modulator NEMO CC2-LZ domain-containing protein n=1 Tax=Euphydryas editha TaxID=104508 RepID=A0AAU9TUB4_EUPED|nr:unnamed protein product [Euphydryas editha]